VKGDLGTIKILASAIGWMFPHFEFAWAVPEFEKDMEMELGESFVV
jgi:hypothetical protein